MEVELGDASKSKDERDEKVSVDSIQKVIKPVSIKALFFKYASTKEKCNGIIHILSIGSIISGVLSPIGYMFYGSLIDKMNRVSVDYDEVNKIMYGMIAFLFSASVFAFAERWFLGYFAEHVTNRYRQDYVKSLLHHDVEYIESISPGRLGQRMSEESSRIVGGLGPGLGVLFRSFSSFIFGIFVGIYYSWELMIVCIAAAPLIIYLGFVLQSMMSAWGELVMKEHQEADSLAEETFRNIKTVASLGAETKIERKYTKVVNDCANLAKKILTKSAVMYSSLNSSSELIRSFLFLLSTIIISYQRKGFPSDLIQAGCMNETVSSVDICFNPTDNFTEICQTLCTEINNCWYMSGDKCLVGGEVLTVLTVVMQSLVALGGAAASLQALAMSRMSAAYFIDVIEHADELDAAGKTGTEPQSNGGDIEFKDVHFRYKSRDAMILNGLNLSIREGEMIGLVGESGCGKSTVLKLLMRLYAPSSGHIEWNGADVSGLSIPWVRDQISYVSQEPVLFSGTIRENIMYGRVGCTEAEMISAAKLVEADAFIRTFPKGYDTFVGELGTSLSGGQKQRIAIARAFLRQPRILVFDEATSALDTQSERIVQRAIESIRSTSTANSGRLSIVVVAHRLSSIRSCDRIVVIDEGRVAEEGTHESLLSKGGIYSGLYQSQENVSTPTPAEEKKDEYIGLQMVASSKNILTMADEENVCEKSHITDEISTPKLRKISWNELLQYVDGRWMLWVGLLGNVLRALATPGDAYASATLQALFYTTDISILWKQGWFCVCILFIVALFIFSGSVVKAVLHSALGENLIFSLRSKSFSKYLSMSVSYFDDEHNLPSIIVSRLSIDCRRIRDIVDRVSTLFENYLLAILSLVLLFTPLGYWKLSLIALVLSPLFLSSEYLQYTYVYKVTEKIDRNLILKSAELTDFLLNIHTIHAYNLADPLYDKIMNDLKETDDLTTSRTNRSAVGTGLTSVFPAIFVTVVLFFGVRMLVNEELSFSQLFLVYFAVLNCSSLLGINMAHTPEIKLAQQSAHNILTLLRTSSNTEKNENNKAIGHDGDIVFDHVSFAYPTRPEATILNDISFTIRAGSSVAFVGPSGCGKSTIISLIQRMYHCCGGVISLNGTDINSLNLDWYRAQLGAVNQEPCLFSGTIRDNVLMGVNGDVSTEIIEEACRQALCLDFINEMPDRFETDLGATGKAVSGGQKQRLALARAILREPHVLLLDEATSALDSENQEKFLQAMKIWRENHRCTVITVAHRLSTIVDSDIIFVVNNGSIVGSGTHDILLSSCPFYADLFSEQIDEATIIK